MHVQYSYNNYNGYYYKYAMVNTNILIYYNKLIIITNKSHTYKKLLLLLNNAIQFYKMGKKDYHILSVIGWSVYKPRVL